MLNQTVQDGIEEYFSRFSTKHVPYFEPDEDDRLWIHDLLHTLLEEKASYKGEQTVAIYQAVILNSTSVSREHGLFPC